MTSAKEKKNICKDCGEDITKAKEKCKSLNKKKQCCYKTRLAVIEECAKVLCHDCWDEDEKNESCFTIYPSTSKNRYCGSCLKLGELKEGEE